MKLSKILATAAVVTCLAVSSAFAAPTAATVPNNDASQQKSGTVKEKKEFKGKGFRHGWGDEKGEQDPVKRLESKKEKVQSLLKEGKITKEKADAINQKIDKKIAAVKEFQGLSLEQKKAKLISNFKAAADSKVKEGKLTQDKADQMLKNFTERIQKWDGTGYPKFRPEGCKGSMQQGNLEKK